jgi:transposase
LALKLNNEIKEIIIANKNIEYEKYDETLRIKEIVGDKKKHIICHSTYKDFTDKESRKSRITKAIAELLKLKEKKFKDHDEMVEKVSKIIFNFKVSKFLNVEYLEKSFEYSQVSINEEFDGIFALETSKLDISANVALEQYKNLKTIERCFRELKNFLELRPMYHYKNQRVKAHVFICFLSYYIYSIIDQQLSKAKINISVETLLDNLKKVTANDLMCKNAKTTKTSIMPSELLKTITALGYKAIIKT